MRQPAMTPCEGDRDEQLSIDLMDIVPHFHSLGRK